MTQFELIAEGYGLVEAPRVDSQNRLLFSDHLYGGVYRRQTDGSIQALIRGRMGVGGMAFGRAGGLIVSGKTVALWNESSGEIPDVFKGHPGRSIKTAVYTSAPSTAIRRLQARKKRLRVISTGSNPTAPQR